MKKLFHTELKGVLFLPEDAAEYVRIKHEADHFSLIEIPEIKKMSTDKLSCLDKINPKEQRNYNRVTLVALEGLYDLNLPEVIDNQDRDRIGVYVAGPWGLYHSKVINAVKVDHLTPAKAMRQHFHPKFNLKNVLALLPGHISIHFKVMGPTNCFIGYGAPAQAFAKSKFDLLDDYVDTALVICLNLYDEPLAATEHAFVEKSTKVEECAAAFILKKDDLVKIESLRSRQDSLKVKNKSYFDSTKNLWGI